jgi:hypothetical protein
LIIHRAFFPPKTVIDDVSRGVEMKTSFKLLIEWMIGAFMPSEKLKNKFTEKRENCFYKVQALCLEIFGLL